MKKNNPIDEHFKEHLQNVEVEPSGDLWSKMEPRLNERGRKRGWFIGVAASVTIAIAVSSYIYDTYQVDTDMMDIPVVVDPVEQDQPASTPPPSHQIESVSTPDVEDIASEESNSGLTSKSSPSSRNTSDREPRMIGQDGGESARRQTALNGNPNSGTSNGEDDPRLLAEVTPDIDTKIRINPERYLAKAEESTEYGDPQTDTREEEDKMALGDYAEKQLDNLLSGKAIVTPEKEQIRWPELSINLSPIIQKFTPEEDNSSTQP